jgi:hypothetical protein
MEDGFTHTNGGWLDSGNTEANHWNTGRRAMGVATFRMGSEQYHSPKLEELSKKLNSVGVLAVQKCVVGYPYLELNLDGNHFVGDERVEWAVNAFVNGDWER